MKAERVALAPGWRFTEQPAPLKGAIAFGCERRPLVRRLLVDLAAFGSLRVWVGETAVIVLGPQEALPWVDGIQYLCSWPEAPNLLLPSAVCPDLPLDLVYAALARRGVIGTVLLWPDPASVVVLNDLQPLSQCDHEWLGQLARAEPSASSTIKSQVPP